MIKSYPQGNISAHMARMKIGDTMKMKGPKGAMVYTPNMCRHIGMIAGGTGITPMLQIVKAIQRGRPLDRTKVDLIFANVNPDDILLKEDLDRLAREDADFNVYYVLNNPPEGWSGGVGICDSGHDQGEAACTGYRYQNYDLWAASYGGCAQEGYGKLGLRKS